MSLYQHPIQSRIRIIPAPRSCRSRNVGVMMHVICSGPEYSRVPAYRMDKYALVRHTCQMHAYTSSDCLAPYLPVSEERLTFYRARVVRSHRLTTCRACFVEEGGAAATIHYDMGCLSDVIRSRTNASHYDKASIYTHYTVCGIGYVVVLGIGTTIEVPSLMTLHVLYAAMRGFQVDT